MEAKAAIIKMGKTLQSNMKKNMKAGGAIQAADFCSKKATDIEKKVNANYQKGISVKRISLKTRNPNNMPKSDEKLVLEQIQNDFENGKKGWLNFMSYHGTNGGLGEVEIQVWHVPQGSGRYLLL